MQPTSTSIPPLTDEQIEALDELGLSYDDCDDESWSRCLASRLRTSSRTRGKAVLSGGIGVREDWNTIPG